MSTAMLNPKNATPLHAVAARVHKLLNSFVGVTVHENWYLKNRTDPSGGWRSWRGDEPPTIGRPNVLPLDRKGRIGLSWPLMGCKVNDRHTPWEILLDAVADRLSPLATVSFKNRTVPYTEGEQAGRFVGRSNSYAGVIPGVPDVSRPHHWRRTHDLNRGRWDSQQVEGLPSDPNDPLVVRELYGPEAGRVDIGYPTIRNPTVGWWGSLVLRIDTPVGPWPFPFTSQDLDPEMIDEEVEDKWMRPGTRVVYKGVRYVHVKSYRLRPNVNRNSNGVYRHMMNLETGAVVYGKTFFGACPDIAPDDVIAD